MLNKSKLIQLKKLIPDFKSELSEKHKLAIDLIKMQYQPNARLTKIKVVTTSCIELITTVLRLDSEGYKVDALASAQARKGVPFSVVAHLNEAQISNALETDLSKAQQSHTNEIENLRQTWIDNELAELITAEENKLTAEIKINTENKKKDLLRALFS